MPLAGWTRGGADGRVARVFITCDKAKDEAADEEDDDDEEEEEVDRLVCNKAVKVFDMVLGGRG